MNKFLKHLHNAAKATAEDDMETRQLLFSLANYLQFGDAYIPQLVGNLEAYLETVKPPVHEPLELMADADEIVSKQIQDYATLQREGFADPDEDEEEEDPLDNPDYVGYMRQGCNFAEGAN